MHKDFIKTGALLGALSIILGAFGAHALKEIFTADILQVYETAVRYQMYHAFALLIVGIVYKEFANKYIRLAGNFFIAGVVLFSGSLYTICFIEYQHLSSLLWIGAITPLGGLCFIIGWLLLFAGAVKKD
ncbi:MAG TPA: DUF423 domain-containing protein [Ferruginibacter sp.]|nr:DUF423 domain-containing protein [Ferruginibacter sp.]